MEHNSKPQEIKYLEMINRERGLVGFGSTEEFNTTIADLEPRNGGESYRIIRERGEDTDKLIVRNEEEACKLDFKNFEGISDDDGNSEAIENLETVLERIGLEVELDDPERLEDVLKGVLYEFDDSNDQKPIGKKFDSNIQRTNFHKIFNEDRRNENKQYVGYVKKNGDKERYIFVNRKTKLCKALKGDNRLKEVSSEDEELAQFKATKKVFHKCDGKTLKELADNWPNSRSQARSSTSW